MNCPNDLGTILVAMLRTGLLRARASAWAGDPARAAIEADHVHNVPDLLDDYSEGRLASYWNSERPSYIAEVGHDSTADWAPLWRELRPFAERTGVATS